MSESRFELFGGKNAGAKAGMLIEHEALINEVGLEVPPTIVLTDELLSPLSKAASESLTPVHKIYDDLEAVLGRHKPGAMLVVRSSADGDAEGTGVYESPFVGNYRRELEYGIIDAIESYRSSSAQTFRRRAKLSDDFAVMIQPLIMQELLGGRRDVSYAPALSGFGYSEARYDAYGKLHVVAGMGGGVSRKGGENVTYGDISIAKQELNDQPKGPINFYDYIGALRIAQKYLNVPEADTDFRNKELLGREDALRGVHGYGFVPQFFGSPALEYTYFNLGEGIDLDAELFKSKTEEDSNPMIKAMKAFSPERMLDQMRRMQDIAGYPLYIEWATRLGENDNLETFVVQAAPYELTERSRVESEIPANAVIAGRNVIGHGVREAKKIVFCANPDSTRLLREYNDAQTEEYILVYSAKLTSSHGSLSFEDISNAGTVVEIHSDIHGSTTMLEHFRGVAEKTSTIFAEFDYDAMSMEDLFLLLQLGTEVTSKSARGHLKIAEGNFKVLADATLDKLIIGRE